LFGVSVQTGRMVDEVMSTERLTGELQRHLLVNVARSKAFALSSEPQVGDALTPEIHQTSLHSRFADFKSEFFRFSLSIEPLVNCGRKSEQVQNTGLHCVEWGHAVPT